MCVFVCVSHLSKQRGGVWSDKASGLDVGSVPVCDAGDKKVHTHMHKYTHI